MASLSEGQAFLKEHLAANLLLARVQSGLKAPERALRTLDALWAEILGADNPTAVGKAKIIRAQCLVACFDQAEYEGLDIGQEGLSHLQEALQLLSESQAVNSSVGCDVGLVTALEDLAKLQHRLGNNFKRDEAAALWQHTSQAMRGSGKSVALLEELDLIQQFSTLVGSNVATR